MDWLKGLKEISDIEGKSPEKRQTLDENALAKFDKLLGDDKIEVKTIVAEPKRKHYSPKELLEKYLGLFDIADMTQNIGESKDSPKESVDVNEIPEKPQDEVSKEADISEKREPNSKYEVDGDIYETDDNGVTYKKNGELLPNVEYSENGHKYKTDENGRITSCEAKPQYNEEGKRKPKDQADSGGAERKEDDDGGHIIAKILNGSEGSENLVPMRITINRGDYKRMENEIAKAIQEGKEVTLCVNIEYDGDSRRPSKIKAEYTIDGKKTVVEYDNKENSTELLDSLEGSIDGEYYQDLKDEIQDMKADGIEASVTSVKTEYDENGNPTKVTVGILNESTGEKSYRVYEPKQES